MELRDLSWVPVDKMGFVALLCFGTPSFAQKSSVPVERPYYNDLSAVEKRNLVKQVASDPMVHAAISDAQKRGKKCDSRYWPVVTHREGLRIVFEMQFACLLTPKQVMNSAGEEELHVQGTATPDGELNPVQLNKIVY